MFHLKRFNFKLLRKYSVKFEKKEKIQFVTLNRPEQLNSLNLEMVEKLIPLYEVYNFVNNS
jgi:enoyl-CoA hydratase/carnithine racemase